MAQASEDIDAHVTTKFDIKKRLGKGAYGIVWKALDTRTQKIVALKKIFDAFRNKTDAQRTYREVMFLQEFGRHPNVVKLTSIIRASNDRDLYLVFEYMDTDLHNVIKRDGILKPVHKQYIMYQLFKAVKYLHSGNVLHRDLKPSNVLLDVNCTVKLADFGLARSLTQLEVEAAKNEGTGNSTTTAPAAELTEYVATRWYRAPEILLSARHYTKGVDLWSLGCILAELMCGAALFPGSSTLNQLERIMVCLPPPNLVDIDSVGSIYARSVIGKMTSSKEAAVSKDGSSMPKMTSLRAVLPLDSPKDAVDLTILLLQFNPYKRLTVMQALTHPYVTAFSNPAEEPALNYDVALSLSDDIQLSVSEYRNKLYEMIASKNVDRRSLIRRIYHEVQPTSDHMTTPPQSKSQGDLTQAESKENQEDNNIDSGISTTSPLTTGNTQHDPAQQQQKQQQVLQQQQQHQDLQQQQQQQKEYHEQKQGWNNKNEQPEPQKRGEHLIDNDAGLNEARTHKHQQQQQQQQQQERQQGHQSTFQKYNKTGGIFTDTGDANTGTKNGQILRTKSVNGGLAQTYPESQISSQPTGPAAPTDIWHTKSEKSDACHANCQRTTPRGNTSERASVRMSVRASIERAAPLARAETTDTDIESTCRSVKSPNNRALIHAYHQAQISAVAAKHMAKVRQGHLANSKSFTNDKSSKPSQGTLFIKNSPRNKMYSLDSKEDEESKGVVHDRKHEHFTGVPQRYKSEANGVDHTPSNFLLTKSTVLKYPSPRSSSFHNSNNNVYHKNEKKHNENNNNNGKQNGRVGMSRSWFGFSRQQIDSTDVGEFSDLNNNKVEQWNQKESDSTSSNNNIATDVATHSNSINNNNSNGVSNNNTTKPQQTEKFWKRFFFRGGAGNQGAPPKRSISSQGGRAHRYVVGGQSMNPSRSFHHQRQLTYCNELA